MDAMAVYPIGGEKYAIHIRGHRVCVDQPLDEGGEDTAPTPTELFAASLGLCVAFYAGRFLDRHGIARTGFEVKVAWRMAEGRRRSGRADRHHHDPAPRDAARAVAGVSRRRAGMHRAPLACAAARGRHLALCVTTIVQCWGQAGESFA
jgi:putative redox protein